MRILAICGSLRAASSNSRLLDALAAVAPATVTLTRYDGLHELPHFNPDEEAQGLPAAVSSARSSPPCPRA